MKTNKSELVASSLVGPGVEWYKLAWYKVAQCKFFLKRTKWAVAHQLLGNEVQKHQDKQASLVL